MGNGLVYEGDGYIHSSPAVAESRPALRTKAPADEPLAPSAMEVEKRARAMRREYLNDWLFWLLDR